MSGIVYIGVDDTDVIGSPGTGKVARGLAKLLTELGLAESLGVSTPTMVGTRLEVRT